MRSLLDEYDIHQCWDDGENENNGDESCFLRDAGSETTKDEEKEILSSTSTQQCRTEDGVMMVDGHVWEPRLS